MRGRTFIKLKRSSRHAVITPDTGKAHIDSAGYILSRHDDDRNAFLARCGERFPPKYAPLRLALIRNIGSFAAPSTITPSPQHDLRQGPVWLMGSGELYGIDKG